MYVFTVDVVNSALHTLEYCDRINVSMYSQHELFFGGPHDASASNNIRQCLRYAM